MECWNSIISRIFKLQVHKDIVVSNSTVPHPINEGFTRSIGDLKGQVADFRKPMPDGRSIHVREFEKYFLVHWDWRDPSLDPIGHLVQDAPHVLLISSIIIAVALGLALWLGGEKG